MDTDGTSGAALASRLSPALWGFPTVASNERSPTNKSLSGRMSHRTCIHYGLLVI